MTQATTKSPFPAINPSTHIRLVHPAQKASTGSPSFIFEIVPIHELKRKKYKALSYSRSDSSAVLHSIQLAQQPFLVQQNVFNFLSASPANEDEPLIPVSDGKDALCFIDALCINQFDNEERQAQMQLIPEVYRYAREVIVSLGQVPPDKLPSIRSLATTKNTTSLTAEQSTAHRYLSHHPYWSQVLALQEVALARKLTIRCGSISLPLHAFSSRSSKPGERSTPAERILSHRHRALLTITRDPLSQGTTVLALDEMVSVLTDELPYGAVKSYHSTVPDSLHEILALHGHLECGDPRDKLYGFLGLLDEQIRAQVQVDYDKGTDFAFRQALKIGLREIMDEMDADLERGEDWHGESVRVARMKVESFYAVAKNMFGMNDEGRWILGGVLEELRIPGWLEEVEWAMAAQPAGGWGAGRIVSFREFGQGETQTGHHHGQGPSGWLGRLHHRQERAARKVEVGLSKARVRMLRI